MKFNLPRVDAHPSAPLERPGVSPPFRSQAQKTIAAGAGAPSVDLLEILTDSELTVTDVLGKSQACQASCRCRSRVSRLQGQGYNQPPLVRQHAPHLRKNSLRFGHVLEQVRPDHEVELAGTER